MIRVGVVGSRNIVDYNFVKQKLEEILRERLGPSWVDGVVIVSGGARGVDSLAQMFAKEFGLTIIIHYPKYKVYGKKAPIIRNNAIVEDSDFIVAFPEKRSRGTWHTVNMAKQRGKEVVVIEVG